VFGIFEGWRTLPEHCGGAAASFVDFLEMDLRGGACTWGWWRLFLFFCLWICSTNVGTMVGVCEQGGFVKNGKIPRVGGECCWRTELERFFGAVDRDVDGDELHRERSVRGRRGRGRD